MHTSYFGNWKNLPKDKVIAICQGVPKWYSGNRYMELAPSWEMVRINDNFRYAKLYAEILSKLDPALTYQKLESMVGGGSILLCWEKPGQSCHRRLVAEWFEKALNIEVSEYPALQPAFSFEEA